MKDSEREYVILQVIDIFNFHKTATNIPLV